MYYNARPTKIDRWAVSGFVEWQMQREACSFFFSVLARVARVYLLLIILTSPALFFFFSNTVHFLFFFLFLSSF